MKKKNIYDTSAFNPSLEVDQTKIKEGKKEIEKITDPELRDRLEQRTEAYWKTKEKEKTGK